eukprot:m.358414 g.358414  ORF g.358414 m.358414 type:complete len:103 (+) comp18142_c0_seq1:2451-2759(+)
MKHACSPHSVVVCTLFFVSSLVDVAVSLHVCLCLYPFGNINTCNQSTISITTNPIKCNSMRLNAIKCKQKVLHLNTRNLHNQATTERKQASEASCRCDSQGG